MRNFLLYSIFIVFVSAIGWAQENAFTSRSLTNRPMLLLNDASSVGWNPSLLGMTDTEFDLVFAMPVNQNFQQNDAFSGFLKFENYSGGFVYNQFGTPSQLYFGTGLELSRNAWFGVGTMLIGETRNLIDSNENKFRYNAALTVSPIKPLLVSVGYSTMFFGAHKSGVVSLGGVYSFTPTISAFTDIKYASDNAFLGGNGIDALAGGNISFLEGLGVLSASYSVQQELFRVGLELRVGNFSAGHIAYASEPGSVGGVALLRLNDARSGTWNAAESFNKRGSGGSLSKDAVCVPSAYKWRPDLLVGTPNDLVRVIETAGEDYNGLVEQLRKLSPDPSKLFDEIIRNYYPLQAKPKSVTGVSTALFTTGAAQQVFVQSIDSTNAERKIALVQAVDKFGRNVGGLTSKSFSIADSKQLVYSVNQTTSEIRTPADIVILMDCSGSMGDEITAVRSNVKSFVENVSTRGIDARIGCILYGDDIIETLEPTSSVAEFLNFFAKARANEPDEITSEAIYQATKMQFRPDAQKIVVLITDDCSLQENADHTEETLTNGLWARGAKLFSVVNPTKHNAGVVTRLTLGRDYDIKQPFTSLLDNISADITTTYEIVYGPKPVEKPRLAVVRGMVADEKDKPIRADLALSSPNKSSYSAKSNPLSGKYEITVKEKDFSKFSATVSAPNYIPATDNIDFSMAKIGDTIVKNFRLRSSITKVVGQIQDEQGVGKRGSVVVEDAQTLRQVGTVNSDENGKYEYVISPGKDYRLTPKVPEYIPTASELQGKSVKLGDNVVLNLRVTSVSEAIDKGMTFRLNNIFFDFAKADINSSSAPELDKLYDFLTEFSSVKVEISAHTDGVGSDESNMTLSNNRAGAVARYLTDKGISAKRIVAKGYGKSKPVADNGTEEGRALNRRVEFKLIK